MKLESFEGLGIIPIDILQRGTKKIVEYLLDLFRSPSGDPLFRSKLMVVGYESVGKTTILDCLFPLEGPNTGLNCRETCSGSTRSEATQCRTRTR